jgi:mannose-1-phosphate guanylyltransferase
MPIHGKTLLEIWIALLDRGGIQHVLINTHYLAHQVEAHVKDLDRRYRLHLQTIWEPSLLGSAGTLVANADFIPLGEDFVIAYADNLTDMAIQPMIAFHRERPVNTLLTMALFHTKNPEACGIATMDDLQRITDFVEKPDCPKGDLANAGVYVASYDTLAVCKALAEGIEQELFDLGHHVLPQLVGRMAGYPMTSYLRDIGTVEAYRLALTEWPYQERMQYDRNSGPG